MNRSINFKLFSPPPFPYEQYSIWRAELHRRLAVEIGCGVGQHPIQWAKSHPGSKILAIERTKDKFERFSRRLKNHPHLKNIFPAHADAAVLLPHLLQVQDQDQEKASDLSNSYRRMVDEYFILYPNPYPKNQHKNRRLAHSPLRNFFEQTLKPGGRITIATNISSYAEELKSEWQKNTSLVLLSDTKISFSAPPRSHFEKKYLSRHEPCINLVFGREA